MNYAMNLRATRIEVSFELLLLMYHSHVCAYARTQVNFIIMRYQDIFTAPSSVLDFSTAIVFFELYHS